MIIYNNLIPSKKKYNNLINKKNLTDVKKIT